MKTPNQKQLQVIVFTLLITLSPIVAVTAFAGTAQAAHSQKEPNDQASDATSVSGGQITDTELGTASSLTGNVNQDSETPLDDYDEDWFSFTPPDTEFVLSVESIPSEEGDIGIEVKDNNENNVATGNTDSDAVNKDYDDDGTTETVTQVSVSGANTGQTYYVKLFAHDDPTNDPNVDAAKACGLNSDGSSSCDGNYELFLSYQPTAAASTDDSDGNVIEGNTVSFDASATTDPDDSQSSLSFSWAFGDGSGSGVKPDHSFTSGTNGGTTTYTPEVTVTDPGGGQDTDTTKQITVYNDYDGDGKADIDNPSPADIDGDTDDDNDGVPDDNDPDPYNTDTDGDGISDGTEDADGDGVLDPGETDPDDTDTDGDSLSDDTEGAASGRDTDGDGTIDARSVDSDGDGTNDGTEGTGDADGDGYEDYRDTAPVFSAGASLSNVREDATTHSGTTIDSLMSGSFDDSSDGDSDSLEGMLITNDASTSSEGTWQYSTDGGSTWTDVGSVSTSSALFVDSADRVRFKPAADYTNTVGALTVRAVDDSETFSTASTKDVSNFGRLSGVSAASGVSVDISIDAVNDAPSVKIGDDQTATTIDGQQTNASFATGFDPGGGSDESTQSVNDYILSNNNSALFGTAPNIDNNGDLTYEPAGDASGTARVGVQVQDDGGTTNGGEDTSAVSTFNITIEDLIDPTADAGSDITVNEDTSFDFDATASADNVGIVSYEWDFGDDSSGTGPTPTHTYSDPGSYKATLTTIDDFGNSDSDTVSVSVRDTTPPTAKTRSDKTIAPGDSVNLFAGPSTDNGEITSYTWQFPDGRTKSGEFVSASYDTPGEYTIQLEVQDAAGFTDTDTVTITVQDPTPPDAVMAGDNQTITAGSQLEFDGSGSTDNIGIDAYQWDFGDGTTATGPTPTHTFESVGTYAVTLTVEDTSGNTDTATRTISVEQATTNRVEVTPSTPQTISAGETVAFNATAFDQFDNEIATDDTAFSWTNTTATGTFESTTAGDYSVAATYNGTTSSPVAVTVEPAAPTQLDVTPQSDTARTSSTAEFTPGTTLNYTVTVTDTAGNPVPETPVTVSTDGSAIQFAAGQQQSTDNSGTVTFSARSSTVQENLTFTFTETATGNTNSVAAKGSFRGGTIEGKVSIAEQFGPTLSTDETLSIDITATPSGGTGESTTTTVSFTGGSNSGKTESYSLSLAPGTYDLAVARNDDETTLDTAPSGSQRAFTTDFTSGTDTTGLEITAGGATEITGKDVTVTETTALSISGTFTVDSPFGPTLTGGEMINATISAKNSTARETISLTEGTGVGTTHSYDLGLEPAEEYTLAITDTTTQALPNRAFNVSFADGTTTTTVEGLAPGGAHSAAQLSLTETSEGLVFLSLNGTNGPVTETNRLTADIRAENPQSKPVTQELIFSVTNTSTATGQPVYTTSQTISIPAESTTSTSFSWRPPLGEAGNYTLTTTGVLDTVSTDAEVLELADAQPELNTSRLPDEIGFGTTDLNTSATEPLVIENTGTTSLRVTPSVTGDNNEQFELTESSSDVPAGETGSLTVAYDPQTRGNATAILEVATNDPETPTQSISLSGRAEAPAVTVSPDSIDFGSDPTGASGTQRSETVSITNTGNDVLTVSEISLSRATAAFASNQSSLTVAANESRQLNVTYTVPETSGTIVDTLELQTDAPESQSIGIDLQALVTDASMGTPERISFGSVSRVSTAAVGAVSGNQTVSRGIFIENTGSTTLSNVTVAIAEETPAFSIQSNGEVGDISATGLGGAYVTVLATANETTLGDQTATLEITTDEIATAETVPVEMTVTQPTVNVPDSLSFAETAVGGSTQTTVTVTNTGDAPLTVDTANAFDSAEQDWATVTGPSQRHLAAGEQTTLGVRFTPSQPGQFEGELTLTTNDPTVDNGTTTVDVSGTAVESNLTASRSNIDFGTVGTASSTTRSFTISNDAGQSAITDLSGTLSGSDSTEFNTTGIPASLANGTSRPVTVTFTPETAGSKTAELTITGTTNSTSEEKSLSVSLSGTADPPAVDINRTDLSFAPQSVTASASTESVEITNTGPVGTTLTVEDVRLIDQETPFSIPTSPAGTILESSASSGDALSVPVAFDPEETDVGSFSTTLKIQTDDPASPIRNVSVAAESRAPTAVVSTAQIAAGTAAGGESTTGTVTLSNDGDAILTISDISITGPDSGAVSLPRTYAGRTIAPGSSQQLAVDVTPPAQGTVSAGVKIATDAPSGLRVADGTALSNNTVSVTASGAAPQLAATPSAGAELSIGETPVDSTGSKTITLENTGKAPLEIAAPEIVNDSAGVYDIAESARTISAGETTQYRVQFTPSSVGPATAQLVFPSTNDETTSQLSFDLAGSGIDTDLAVSSDSVSFGDIQLDETRTEAVSISNIGAVDAEITTVDIQGSDSTQFGTNLTAPASVQAGSAQKVAVTATPSVTGQLTATLVVGFADGTTRTVSLAASGTAPEPVITDALSYNDTRVGDSVEQSITLSNDGNAEYTITNVSVTGDTDQFDTTVGELAGSRVGVTATVSAAVTFAPTDATTALSGGSGTSSLTVTITTDEGTTETIDVTATSITPALEVENPVNFGDVQLGERVLTNVTVENAPRATAPITLADATLGGEDPQDFEIENRQQLADRELAPNEQFNITVAFEPSEPETRSATLRLDTADTRQPSKIVSLTNSETYVTVEFGSTLVDYFNTEPRNQPATDVYRGSKRDGAFEQFNLTAATGGDMQVNFTDVSEANVSEELSAGFAEIDRSTYTQEYDRLRVFDSETTLSEANFVKGTLQFRVTKATLAEAGVDITDETAVEESVVLFHSHDAEAFSEQPISLVADLGSSFVFETTYNEFSTSALSVESFNPDLTDVNVPDTVERNSSLSVSADIENVGGEAGDAVTELVIDDQRQATVTETLTKGDSTTVSLESDNITTATGNVTAELRVENDENGEVVATQNKTVTVTAESEDEESDNGGSTSSGGGGGLVGPAARGGSPDGVLVADSPAVGGEDSIGAIRADQLRVETTTTDEATLVVQTYEADLTPSDRLRTGGSSSGQNATDLTTQEDINSAAASFESTTGTVAGGYVDIETDLSAAEINNATLTFRIRESYLSELGSDPSDVRLYRQTEGEWEAQETAHLGTNNSFQKYESRMPGFSMFALGTGADVTRINDSVSLTGAGAEDNMVTVGEAVTVSAIVENRGQTRATETFELTANGEVVASEEISITGGSNETVVLEFRPDSTGEYTLGVGEQEVPLTVEADSGFPWWTVVIIAIAVSVLLFVLWRRRADVEEEQQPHL